MVGPSFASMPSIFRVFASRPLSGPPETHRRSSSRGTPPHVLGLKRAPLATPWYEWRSPEWPRRNTESHRLRRLSGTKDLHHSTAQSAVDQNFVRGSFWLPGSTHPMVRLRLTRMGRKQQPFYRIVAADSRAPRDGRFIEAIGHYNPMQNPPDIRIDLERVDYWIGVGASPSDTVSGLIKRVRGATEASEEQS